MSSEVTGNGLELFAVEVAVQTVVHVIVYQGLLGIAHSAFNRLQLLGHIKAGPPFLDHRGDRTKMPFGAFQPRYDLGVACMRVSFCHTPLVTPLGGYRKRRVRDGMVALKTGWMGRLAGLLCVLALLVSSIVPTPHVPRLMQVLTDHAEMIAEHGHSHGLEEDLSWALHGHSHEKADHDHSPALLPLHRFKVIPVEVAVLWHSPDAGYKPPPVYRQLRPPRGLITV